MAKFVQLKDGFDPAKICGACGGLLNKNFEGINQAVQLFLDQAITISNQTVTIQCDSPKDAEKIFSWLSSAKEAAEKESQDAK